MSSKPFRTLRGFGTLTLGASGCPKCGSKKKPRRVYNDFTECGSGGLNTLGVVCAECGYCIGKELPADCEIAEVISLDKEDCDEIIASARQKLKDHLRRNRRITLPQMLFAIGLAFWIGMCVAWSLDDYVEKRMAVIQAQTQKVQP